MTNYTTSSDKSDDTDGSIDLSDRERRALEQYLTVTPEIGRARDAPGLAVVSSESGREYLVDVEAGRCQRKDGAVCPDQEYNLGDEEVCKHVIRARVELGGRPISSAELATADVDPQLGEHTNGPVVVTSDGGVVGAESDDDHDSEDGRPDDCECTPAIARSGMPCWSCYREGFDSPAAVGEDDGADERTRPAGSEPADFGGGESTGVQDL